MHSQPLQRSTVLFASGTSGTGSMRRLHCKLTGIEIGDTKFVERLIEEGNRQLLPESIVPTDGGMYLFNLPPVFNRAHQLNDYRFIVNFRDPRDRLCNMYHWEFVHPKPTLSPDQLTAHHKKVAEEGIDAWVLKRMDVRYYDTFWWLLEQPDCKHIVQSYARLCLDFNNYVKRSCDFLGIELTDEVMQRVENEASESLQENPRWIGNRWQGSDTSPGRFRRELRAETIEQLNKAFADVLDKMAGYDPDFAETYR